MPYWDFTLNKMVEDEMPGSGNFPPLPASVMDDPIEPGHRDGHKNRIYAAENMTFSWTPDLANEKAVQAYCDKVVRSAKFKKLWTEAYAKDYHTAARTFGATPPVKVIVKFTRGTGARVYRKRTVLYRARATKNFPRPTMHQVPYIEIGNRGKCSHVVLHELAHLLSPDDKGHGRDFARVFLALVRRFFPEQAPTLLAQYKQRRIRYSRTPSPATSTSQRAASR